MTPNTTECRKADRRNAFTTDLYVSPMRRVGSDRRHVSPAISEFAMQDAARLRAECRTLRAEKEALRVALERARIAMEAFTDPEDKMPADSGEYRDLKAALIIARAALAKLTP